MTDKIVVTTTCGSMEEAERIARHVVEQRVAACAQITQGLRSVYRWKGQMEDQFEVQVTMKSRRDLFGPLCEELRKVHTYEVPEIVALPVIDASAPYAQWMDDELRQPRTL